MYYNNTLPSQVSMAVIVRLLPKNPNVAGSNPSVDTFFLIIFIYKLYLYFINYTTHNKTRLFHCQANHSLELETSETSKGKKSVIAAEWENCVRHVFGIERQYWQIDIAVDEVQDPVVLCLGKTDSKAESSDSDTAKGEQVSLICICQNETDKILQNE